MAAPHLGVKPVACKLHSETRHRTRSAVAYTCIAVLSVVLCGSVFLAGYYGLRYYDLLRTIECESKKQQLQYVTNHTITAQTTEPNVATTTTMEPTTLTTSTQIPTTTVSSVKVQASDVIYTWKLRIVRRQEWSGNHAYQPDPLKIPVSYVIVMHTDTEQCISETDCTYVVRHIQTKHKGFGLYLIGYNFLIGGDGNVYEGRGWYRRGVYLGSYTTRAISIGFIGSFLSAPPDVRQIETAQQLIANGVKFGTIAPDYKLIADPQLVVIESDGNTFYDVLKTLPHWSDEIPE